MFRFLLLVGLLLLGVVIAFLLQKRRPEPPTAPTYRVPSQVAREDFLQDARPVLVVLFSSLSCNSCPVVWEVLEAIDNELVVFQKVDVETDPSLHKRYKIDGVPTTLIVDPQGTVQQSFLGLFTKEELTASLPSGI